MKVIQSSFFRAICAMVVGVLLIKYREQTVQWITIAIGVLFFLSGVVSCATYFSACRQKDTPQVFDAQGRQLTGFKPTFPIVGVGSLVLGLVLALMPGTFVQWLMFVLAALLILGALNQFVALAAVRSYMRVGIYYWVMPSVILLVGLLALLFPSAIASAPLFVIGWCMLLYGVVEVINALQIGAARRRAVKMSETVNKENEELQEKAEALDSPDAKGEDKA